MGEWVRYVVPDADVNVRDVSASSTFCKSDARSGDAAMPNSSTFTPRSGSVTDASATTRACMVLRRLGQLSLGDRRARRCVDERDGFADHLHAADEPVQCVLEHARHPVGVLRAADENRIGRRDLRAQIRDRSRERVAVVAWIEMGKAGETGVDHDLDVSGGDEPRGAHDRGVGRRGPKAAGNGEDANHALIDLSTAPSQVL